MTWPGAAGTRGPRRSRCRGSGTCAASGRGEATWRRAARQSLSAAAPGVGPPGDSPTPTRLGEKHKQLSLGEVRAYVRACVDDANSSEWPLVTRDLHYGRPRRICHHPCRDQGQEDQTLRYAPFTLRYTRSIQSTAAKVRGRVHHSALRCSTHASQSAVLSQRR